MPRPTSYLGVSGGEDHLIVLKMCPVTNGLPTRMTKPGFDGLCKAQQSASGRWAHGVLDRRQGKVPYCAVCKGKRLPAELEIVKLADLKKNQGENDMPGKKWGNKKCDCCGKEKTIVSQCSGDLVCSACASLYGAINHRPEKVISSINKLRPELFMELAGSPVVPVHVESSALKAIAEIVGYEGEDGDQLLQAVRTFGLQEAPELPLDLIKALDCTADDWEMAAIQTAALLEQAIGQRIIDAGQINQLRNDLGALAQGADRMREQLDRIKEEYTMTVDRLHELEQQYAGHLQVFAQLADLVQGNPEYPAELPSRFAALLSKAAVDGALVPLKINVHEKMRDTFLLDLALDALRGNVKGIDPQWIAVMREVA
jgi:hypothetical protein